MCLFDKLIEHGCYHIHNTNINDEKSIKKRALIKSKIYNLNEENIQRYSNFEFLKH